MNNLECFWNMSAYRFVRHDLLWSQTKKLKKGNSLWHYHNIIRFLNVIFEFASELWSSNQFWIIERCKLIPSGTGGFEVQGRDERTVMSLVCHVTSLSHVFKIWSVTVTSLSRFFRDRRVTVTTLSRFFCDRHVTVTTLSRFFRDKRVTVTTLSQFFVTRVSLSLGCHDFLGTSLSLSLICHDFFVPRLSLSRFCRDKRVTITSLSLSLVCHEFLWQTYHCH